MTDFTFPAVLIGCGNMGRNQAKLLAAHPALDLVGVADLDTAAAKDIGATHGVPAWDDADAMLTAVRPVVVVITSGSSAHVPLVELALRHASVRAIYAEKPLALHAGDQRRVIAACAARGVDLAVNHQRRLLPATHVLKEQLDQGTIGTVRRFTLGCPGDLLSDGTHALDGLLFLRGDRMPVEVSGAVTRDMEILRARFEQRGHTDRPGYRYGHAVEAGCWALLRWDDGVEAELRVGCWATPWRAYQDWVVHGDGGWLWRPGDKPEFPLYLADGKPGSHREARTNWPERPQPHPDGGPWRPVEAHIENVDAAIRLGYDATVAQLRDGTPHPLRAELTGGAVELAMAILASARDGVPVKPPVADMHSPLDDIIAHQTTPE